MGLLFDATRGALAGAAATWVMDLVTTGLLQQQPDEVTAREEAAQPNGQSSIANMLDRFEERTGISIPEDRRPMAMQAVHFGLGVVPGAVYAVARKRLPLVGMAGGLVYGAVLWGANDEWANTKLGFAAPPDAYPTETHVRGLVGHLVLGAVTDSVLDALPG